jgi:hypothetical protein
LLPLLLLCACAKKDAAPAGPHATVQLRDGTTASGAVVSNSASEIRLAGDDGVTRTIPTAQVRSIDYGAAPPPPAAPSAPAAPAAPADAADAQADQLHEQHYHPTESVVTTKTYVLAAGTQIPVRSEESIDSAKAVEGQTYAAEVTRNVRDASGDVVIPRGANARIIIRSASKGGHIRGTSDLVLDLASVSIGGRQYRLETVDIVERGHQGVGANKRTAEFAGGGAAVGAIIGAIAGGGKGAGIGAGSGAAAGAVGQILTKGSAVRVPAESVLTFQLERSLKVTAGS